MSDISAAVTHIIGEMAPVVEGEELRDLLSEIESSADAEDAMGAAVGAFVQAGIDYEVGLARLAEILQVQEIRSNGSQE